MRGDRLSETLLTILPLLLLLLLLLLPPGQAQCEERPGWLSCNTTTASCLSPAQLCDGQADCEDLSDEAAELCSRLVCEEGVRCEDGSACIRVPHQVVCRGQERSVCEDRSDQVHCLNTVYSGCLVTTAMGLTISPCSQCLCHIPGPAGLYTSLGPSSRSSQVTANICVGLASPQLCDGVLDCQHAEDEDPALCAGHQSDQAKAGPGVRMMTTIVVTIFLICFTFCLLIIFIMLKLCCQKQEDRDEAKSMSELGSSRSVSSNVYVMEGRREKQHRSLRTTKIIKQLGTGCFSKVFLSEDKYHGYVAIKTTQPSNSQMAEKSIRNEISILKELWKHSNVIQMLDSNVEERFLVLEYCLHGNCKDYIGRNKNLFVNQIDPETQEMKIDEDEDFPFISSDLLDTKTLVKWSLDVCRGMSYLAKLNIIHRDLALRNLLLSANRTVKISDLGLAMFSQSSQSSQCWRENERPVPYKHSALESLVSGVYSSQSDVWALGVTLWEMFSLASEPHTEITSPAQLVQKLETGERLPVCPLAPRSLQAVMESCWADQPDLRPSFMRITNLVKPLLILHQTPVPARKNLAVHYSVPRSTPVVNSRSFYYWTNYKVMQGRPVTCSDPTQNTHSAGEN